MNLLSVSRILPLHVPPPLTSCSYNKPPQNPRILKSSSAPIPAARDRVIDFGKHKGKMMGTLPSTYLKWVSKNLRARDFEEWAQLADQVLEDPVYKDRIEWEFAQNVLNGDVLRSSSSTTTSSSSSRSGHEEESPVSKLAEVSERFGWDYEDEVGWAKVDFGLLGTSKGGRLPRLSGSGPRPNEIGSDPTTLQTSSKASSIMSRLSSSSGPRPVRDVGEKRRERMQRMKLRRNGSLKLKEDRDGMVNFGNSTEVVLETKGGGGADSDKEESTRTNIDKSSFPGREALLKKVLKRRGQ